MTDREQLELAAKAAGIVLDTAKPGEVSDKQCHARVWDRGGWVTVLFYSDSRDHPMCRKPSTPGNVEWNPLADDGDALRLAVKLGLKVTIGHSITMVEHPRIPDVGVEFYEGAEAATRRAIVRAAAALASRKGEPS